MRLRKTTKDISVNAIAGTHVVLLGLDATESAARGLLGFRISRRTGKTGAFKPLIGGREFQGADRKDAVIQAFLWGDYVVEPKTTYTYRVEPVYGKPGALEARQAVELTITTEDPEDATQAIYFNRGVAGSQAYSRQFGKYRRWHLVESEGPKRRKPQSQQFVKPEDVPNGEAYRWLSRGLEEAMLAYLNQAKGPEYAIRAAVYEFTYTPAIQAFVDALERGVDVKIVHHAKRETVLRLKGNAKTDPKTDVTLSYQDGQHDPVVYKNKLVSTESNKDAVCQAADAAVSRIGLTKESCLEAFDQMLIERTITQISHNKFIVLLKNGKPIQVWTGSTNFTAGGIFGQLNVGHIVRDPNVAQKYLEYWEKLATDPKKLSAKSDPPDTGLANWTVRKQPDFTGPPPPNSITPVFSPRLTNAMLKWYAERLDAARNSVFFTAAFSVAKEILEKVKQEKKVAQGEPYLRYLLLEGISGLMKPTYPVMRECRQNRIAWGDTLRTRAGEEEEHEQLIETLTGLNDHVNYLHTKFMLIDPLSDDPVVVTGSANFSDASTTSNDENMLIIRGDTRVADIFLGEFMRLFNHFHSRNRRNELSDEEEKQARYLTPDDSWGKPYYTAGTQQQSERLLFSGASRGGS